jgi:hypothetical protein
MDYIFKFWQGFMQYSMEFTDSSAVGPALDEILRCVNAFRVRAGLLYLTPSSKKSPPIHRIPSNLRTLGEVNAWMFNTHKPATSRCLGAIAADDHRIVVNASHITGDGIFVARLLEHLSRPSLYGSRPAAVLPLSVYNDTFYDAMWRSKGSSIVCGEDSSISRLLPKLPFKTKAPEYAIKYVWEPISALRAFNPATNTLRGLSENIWVAMGIAWVAFEGKISPFGISTVLDLRRLLPQRQRANPALQDCIASVAVRAAPTPDMTLGDLAAAMRRNFEERMRNEDYFGHMKCVYKCVYKPWKAQRPPGLGLEMSSIGPIRIANPMKNCHLTLMAPGEFALLSVSFMNYTVEHRERGTKQFCGQFQYTTKELNPKDAVVFTESIRHGMTKFWPEMTVGDAIDEVREFQRKLRK